MLIPARPAVAVPGAAPRLQWLDALRGIAALAVFATHAVPLASDGLPTPLRFDLGQFGVVLFFLISGYIVPVSLQRHGSLGRFWRRRVWRLAPLYLLSLALVALWFRFGLVPADARGWFFARPTLAALPAHLLEVPILLGVPLWLSVYWTLNVEMVWYALVALLHRAGLLVQPVRVALAAWAVAFVGLLWLSLPAWYGLLGYLALMTTGWMLHAVPLRRSWPVVALCMGAWVALTVLVAPSLLSPRLAACAVFVGTVAWQPVRVPRALLAVGHSSYSLYLLHLFVLAAVPRQTTTSATLAVWSVALVAVTAAGYWLIERPAMRLACRLNPVAQPFHRRPRPSTGLSPFPERRRVVRNR